MENNIEAVKENIMDNIIPLIGCNKYSKKTSRW